MSYGQAKLDMIQWASFYVGRMGSIYLIYAVCQMLYRNSCNNNMSASRKQAYSGTCKPEIHTIHVPWNIPI